MNLNNILIYGLGLMGASLSLAIKKKLPDSKITGVVRSLNSKKAGTEKKIADEIYTEEEFLKQGSWKKFDFVVFSLPVDSTVDKIQLIPDDYCGFITDLGSTKFDIVSAVERKFKGEHNYYSSHPMAGSEQNGLSHASGDLYECRLCILTAPERASLKSKEFIREFWSLLGMKVIEIGGSDHDEILSYLSHSPHIISSLLAIWAYQNDKVQKFTDKSPIPLTGGGFRDMTRIAGSNPEMWQAIFQTNRKNVKKALLDFRDQLNELIYQFDIESDNFWIDYFEKSKASKNKILKS